MNKRLRVVLNILLAALVAAGLFALLRQRQNWREGEEARDRAVQTVRFAPPEPSAPSAPAQKNSPPEPVPATGSKDPVAKELMELDLGALTAENGDVAGWIYLPGTDISYPLLQGADNDYYLKHTWEKKWNAGGSIFLDSRAARGLTDFHTVIYGHRMNNGNMFAPLKEYADPDFCREHPYIYIADGALVRRYEIFAVWEPSVDSLVYTSECASAEDRQALIDLCVGGSEVDTGVRPGPEDHLLTLSTCTGRGHATRWVVQGRLEQTWEAE